MSSAPCAAGLAVREVQREMMMVLDDARKIVNQWFAVRSCDYFYQSHDLLTFNRTCSLT